MAVNAPSLFRIEHNQGFGDAVALTAALRHLRHYCPQSRIELIVKAGREALYEGLADEISSDHDLRRPPTHALRWELASRSYEDSPSTYVEQCLRNVFQMQPIEDLCGYLVHVCHRCQSKAKSLLVNVERARPKLALCHFRGASAKQAKDLNDYEAAGVVDALSESGYDVLIWDENERMILPEQGFGMRVPETFYEPPLDSRLLCGLMKSVDLFVGVDSGPLHLAAAVGTPFIGLWPPPANGDAKHPLHCICPATRSAHVMRKPRQHVVEYERFMVCRDIDVGLKYFKDHYRHLWVDDYSSGISQILAEGI